MIRTTSILCLLAGCLASPTLATAATSLVNAIEACETDNGGPGSCTIELACGTTYPLWDYAEGEPPGILANVDNVPGGIRIVGCGESSVIQYDNRASSDGHQLFRMNGSAKGLKLEKLRIEVLAPCTAGSSCGALYFFRAFQGAENLVLDDVTIAMDPDGSNTRVFANFDGFAGLRVRDSRIDVAFRGVTTNAECTDCVIENNDFRFVTTAAFSPSDDLYSMMILKNNNSPVRIVNNTFDLETDWPGRSRGVRLGGSPADPPNHAQVIGNSFIHFPDTNEAAGIEIYNYNHALIASNTFVGDGPGTLAKGILFHPGRRANGSEAFVTAYNTVTGNMFNKFARPTLQPESTDGCAIELSSGPGGPEPTARVQNIITSNHFGTGTHEVPPVFQPNDGICDFYADPNTGENRQLQLNTVGNNFTH